jgi:pimeloyl-ACP methyl ester carboxylesterase
MSSDDGLLPRAVEFRTRDGLVLRGDQWTGGPHSVLLLHGGGQSRWSWKATGRVLGDAGFTAIALDSRGHGDSDRAPGGHYHFDYFALDVQDVVAQLAGPPALVGASLGGISGLLASAALPPPGLAALVLVDVVAHNNPAGVARIAAFMRSTVNGFATLDAAAQAIADYLPQRSRRGPSDGLGRMLRRDDATGRWMWRWDPGFLDTAFSADDDLPARLIGAASRLTVPCLIVRGGASDVVSRESADALAGAIPGAEHAVVDGAGHTVAGDRNDAFSGVILDFLQRRPRWDTPTAPHVPSGG